MDELEFRRRIFANPSDDDPELREAMDTSGNKAFVDEMQKLDRDIFTALERVEVPEGLADRILFQQSGTQMQAQQKQRRHLAMAASVALVVGLLIGAVLNTTSPSHSDAPPSLAHVAIQHVEREMPFVRHLDERVTLSQVNTKLAPFGKQFNALDEQITYLNHCSFGDGLALHMVMKTELGAVTVFVVPENSPQIQSVNDDAYQSVVMPLQDASLIVVGDKGTSLTPMVEKLKGHLDQAI